MMKEGRKNPYFNCPHDYFEVNPITIYTEGKSLRVSGFSRFFILSVTVFQNCSNKFWNYTKCLLLFTKVIKHPRCQFVRMKKKISVVKNVKEIMSFKVLWQFLFSLENGKFDFLESFRETFYENF